MGYTTNFDGIGFALSRPATQDEFNYINKFSETRRMSRNVDVLMKLYKGEHGFPNFENKVNRTPEEIYGVDGAYFVGGDYGQDRDKSINDYNTPPGHITREELEDFHQRWDDNLNRVSLGLAQPGLWCQWILENESLLTWDGGEKFYSYIEWLKYLIDNFFEPWGIKLNGFINWNGEDDSDIGRIEVKDNVIKVYDGHVEFRVREI